MNKKILIITLSLCLILVACGSDGDDRNQSKSNPPSLDEPGADAGGADFTPYFKDDFESYADGESLTNNNPFDAAGRTTASQEQSYSGSTSARMEIRGGDNGGFGHWGGIIPITPNLGKGGEIWVRMRVYWPQEFEFSATPWMKFIRLHNRNSHGENGGHNDLYVDEADKSESVLRCIKEQHDQWQVYNGNPIPRDQWETYEMYLFVDELSVDEGGQGRMRIWRDTELIFDRTDVPTISDAGGVIDYLYIFTYWNNEMPPNNIVYLDDIVIATNESPPNHQDANGNVFIGDLKQ